MHLFDTDVVDRERPHRSASCPPGGPGSPLLNRPSVHEIGHESQERKRRSPPNGRMGLISGGPPIQPVRVPPEIYLIVTKNPFKSVINSITGN